MSAETAVQNGKFRLLADEFSAVAFFGCRSCLSPLPVTCLTFLQREGVRGKAKVSQEENHLKVHILHAMDSLIMLVSVPAVKAEAKALIKKFFSRVQRCESEADWKHLKIPHNWKTTKNKE